ncbi:hypothetical protein KKG83_03810 [Candidatus Micrarchaeota archaeon]|nr:hypothetical protein [Candidatus Micrarchaeota archaeon]MBU2476571.1 hypothetical protein [Candidatus Micrarchaeota archaeon]
MKQEAVLKLLDELLILDDVFACMVAKKGLEGIVPKKIKINDIDLWRLIRQTTDQMFILIDRFYDYGFDRLYFKLGEYTVIIAPVSRTFSLLVLVRPLANIGLLDIEVENIKRKIKTLAEIK